MYNEQTFTNLLHNINIITKKYEEFAKITGENFNVFSILKVESSEVRLHSAFLGELLSPLGSHGQNDTFLQLFVKQLNIDDFDTNKAIIEVEKHIGAVTETDGGRIDIMITSGNTPSKTIIIENKIYANDGINQLLRYFNFSKQHNTKAEIFYLTLFGTEPTKGSTNGMPSDKFTRLSYQSDIIQWLEVCRKEAATHPILRETITQYIYLLKKLTQQSTNVNMEKEIHGTLLNSEENFKAAQLIGAEIDQLTIFIATTCLHELEEAWKKKYYTPEREMLFFAYREYEFIMRPYLDEKMKDKLNRLHFDFFPMKEGQFGVANNSDIPVIFKEIAKGFCEPQNFFSNGNFTAWIYSKYALENLPFAEYKMLYGNRDLWVDKVLAESDEFIKYFYTEINKHQQIASEIKFNPLLKLGV